MNQKEGECIWKTSVLFGREMKGSFILDDLLERESK